MRAEVGSLEDAIGYRFRNHTILECALTHSSHAHETSAAAGEQPARDNEQLEFLGDSVLGLLISEALVERFPTFAEGQLSKMKAHIVSAVHLRQVAERLDLGRYLKLGRGEEMSGGRSKRTLLVDALEALIAAIYLEGGLEPTRKFVRQHVVGEAALEPLLTDGSPKDFKSALQELARARGLPLPRYIVMKETGPEHAKTFMVEVRVGRDFSAQAEGNSKKSAAQKAAGLVFEQLVAANEMRRPSLD